MPQKVLLVVAKALCYYFPDYQKVENSWTSILESFFLGKVSVARTIASGKYPEICPAWDSYQKDGYYNFTWIICDDSGKLQQNDM